MSIFDGKGAFIRQDPESKEALRLQKYTIPENTKSDCASYRNTSNPSLTARLRANANDTSVSRSFVINDSAPGPCRILSSEMGHGPHNARSPFRIVLV